MFKGWFSRSAARTRWSAFGAAVAVTIAGGGLLGANASGTESTSVFTAIAPCRILDTRSSTPVGPRSTPLGAAETYSISTFGNNGNCALPPAFTALALNVTVVNPTTASYLTVFPAGGSLPTASNLNYVGGQAPVPNAVTVAVAADGRISFYNNGGSVDVIADVVGYYASHNHDDRYYTKAQVDASIAAIPAPTRVLSSLYSAATYKMATDGCSAGEARLVRARQWAASNVMPASFPCVALPTWADFAELNAGSVSWYAPLSGSLPAGIRVTPDFTIGVNQPVIDSASITFQCATVPVPGAMLLNCQMLVRGVVSTYPFNAKAAVDAVIAANLESNAVQLTQYIPANP